MSFLDHAKIVKVATRDVPARFRDDAVQASYLGILKGIGREAENPAGYLYKCARHEVIELLAALSFPMRITKQHLLKAWRCEKEKAATI